MATVARNPLVQHHIRPQVRKGEPHPNQVEPLTPKEHMFYTSTKRHIGGRALTARIPGTPTLQVVEDGVAMHDLGSAQELTARPQTVTPGSTRGLNRKRVIARRENETHIEKTLRPARAQPYPPPHRS